MSYKPDRSLPDHVTIPNWDAYQVRGTSNNARFSVNPTADQPKRAAKAAAKALRNAARQDGKKQAASH